MIMATKIFSNDTLKHRRQATKVIVSSSILPLQQDDDNAKEKTSTTMKDRPHLIRPQRLALPLVVIIAIYCLRRAYFELERSITDPFLEAKLFMPFRYLQVRFFDENPTLPDKVYRMTSTNSFVINLDKDVKRMESFRHMNGKAADHIQRFPATAWLKPSDKNNDDKAIRKVQSISPQQEQWEQRYPFLKYSAKDNRYGDAGCTFSHIQLLRQFVTMSQANESYMFVFEDDAQILEPLLSQDRAVVAPSDADVVLLVSTATKTVKVPYANLSHQHDTNDYAVRVIQGYGAQGYIITQQGAQRLLTHLEYYNQPSDVAMTSSPNLRVYLSKPSPLVLHHRTSAGSSRHSLNRGG